MTSVPDKSPAISEPGTNKSKAKNKYEKWRRFKNVNGAYLFQRSVFTRDNKLGKQSGKWKYRRMRMKIPLEFFIQNSLFLRHFVSCKWCCGAGRNGKIRIVYTYWIVVGSVKHSKWIFFVIPTKSATVLSALSPLSHTTGCPREGATCYRSLSPPLKRHRIRDPLIKHPCDYILR